MTYDIYYIRKVFQFMKIMDIRKSLYKEGSSIIIISLNA
jgi:hypothetical protein